MTLALIALWHMLFFSPQSITFPGPGSGNNGGGGGSTPFLTSFLASAGTRNDIDGCVGFVFTVGSAPLIVTDLGRWITSTNSATHVVRIVTFTGAQITNAQSTIATTGGTPGTWKYNSITPVTLSATTQYWVMSDEVNGGDLWQDQDNVTTTGDGSLVISAYSVAASNCAADPVSGLTSLGAGNAYVPPNFKYHL